MIAAAALSRRWVDAARSSVEPTVAARAPRAPKPSQRLDADALRLLEVLLASHDIERIATFSRQSESTVRRFVEGGTGARASAHMLAQAVVVAFCTLRPELVAAERETLMRLAREHTPGGVGLALPALTVAAAPRARSRAPRERAARIDSAGPVSNAALQRAMSATPEHLDGA